MSYKVTYREDFRGLTRLLLFVAGISGLSFSTTVIVGVCYLAGRA